MIFLYLLQFAKRYSRGEPVTGGYLRRAVGWPLKPARTLKELKHYEKAYEVSDLYLWLQLSDTYNHHISGYHVRPTSMHCVMNHKPSMYQY